MTKTSNIPGFQLPKFLQDFLHAMNNSKFGHSLKKWMAVGVFWLIAHIVEKNTTPDNLIPVLGILGGLLATLMGLNSFFVHKDRQLSKDEPKDQEP